ncbi:MULTISPECIES: DUF2589 domain-containing protein [Ferrimonas]|uniref:DUF2589 domain-containing protein n=1 Tax=Ferrimonas TaxID=44011 RepID=UPI00041D7F3C|nr:MULTISPECIES: DUF2589 domain-containing protein [Ferrimonas]USD36026.1 DUF2589 domain-containing protein [Ferrimonas sp. SCSIO 43195]
MKLHELVEAIMDSVTEAQQRIEQQNIQNLLQYFDHDSSDDSLTPKSIELKFPGTSVDHHGDTVMENGCVKVEHQTVQVPLLSLLQVNPIKIKDMSVQFELGLGEVETLTPDSEGGRGPDPLSNLLNRDCRRKVMNTELNPRSVFGRNKDRNAEVTITFESGELPEGYLKINSQLMKLF